MLIWTLFRPSGLGSGPVAKTNPQTDNRLLLLIWHRCRLPVYFLSFLPQEGSEALLQCGALWVFLNEFLSWTIGHFWTLDAPHRGRRCPESARACGRGRIWGFIGKTDAWRGKFEFFFTHKIWLLNEAGWSWLKKKECVICFRESGRLYDH